MKTNRDIIVIGLGGMGSAAAYHLAARGHRVLGLERFGPAHNRGSSHGGSRITRQSYFEDPAYVPLLLRSYELFEKLERDTGRDIATLCGGVMLGRPDSRTVAGSLRSARQWGLPHELLDAKEVRRRFPTLTPGDDEVALYEERAGFVRPEATVTAHVRLALQAGAELRFEEPVTRWEVLPGGKGVRVHTADDVYTAGHLVVCPGAWAPRLLADLGVSFTIERQIMYWFHPRGGTVPFEPGRHPIYIWEDAEGVQIYGFPAIEGPDGGAKAAFFRKAGDCDPETIDRTVHDEETAAMAAQLAPRLPQLPGSLRKAVTCMYTTTPDEHFVLARHPGHPEAVTVACGFSGHGFKFVPVIGEIVADLALNGTTEHPIALFDPLRRFGTPGQSDPLSQSATPEGDTTT
ncbi:MULTISPECIES: N-methyl-L-tryptophan oxidase [unclassified Streptomyces]|uniref:N-methyl-L-tryptophan oxidase n=1 Tax=unclassified Streptomyces TaxID=2593676 RepID=UPI002DDBA149|nr:MULTISPECIES: N-methyl-L-tryptophan oxidase [unclassified Streptomyces]WSA90965.1 N-methyl-L-tryptophan oxidase [Streptomyces sp. NBC_01795]WSB75290.1 N-methyl-L-tryptophan oxidase [Streptomyces sp. NBC_01775]WSS45245.1 N-methyl-L-tryptophan oxidase [Streptomyces sp. NBC_01187]